MDPSQYQMDTSPAVAAFRSVKAAKNCFMLLVALAIGVQLASFVSVRWVGVIDQLEGPPAAQAVATRPAMHKADRPKALAVAETWREVLHWTMSAAKFLAFVAGILAILTLMFAVKLSIIGRLGGIAGFMSAFFWSLMMLAFLTPWKQILGEGFAVGALYNLGDLIEATATIKPSWGAADVQLVDQIIYYGRFAAYPVLALLLWLDVMLKFASGYRDSIVSPIGTVPRQQTDESSV